ncbi:MAG: hypothetical protein ACREFY_04695 [Acetobacteraceae bacterium]
MAQHPIMVSGEETPDAFFRDRQRFWHSWTRFVVGVVTFVVILLILMVVFLV